jgi:hypothetical protein
MMGSISSPPPLPDAFESAMLALAREAALHEHRPAARIAAELGVRPEVIR